MAIVSNNEISCSCVSDKLAAGGDVEQLAESKNGRSAAGARPDFLKHALIAHHTQDPGGANEAWTFY